MAPSFEKTSVWIHGGSGRMGQKISELLDSEPYAGQWILAGSSDKNRSLLSTTEQELKHVDCILDFTGAEGCQSLYEFMIRTELRNKTLLLGSTGIPQTLSRLWERYAGEHDCRLMIAPNTSYGILLTLRAALSIAESCATHGFDIEIEETHHRHKTDAPGGTALFLAENLAEETSSHILTQRDGKRKQGEIGLHSSRGGGVFGEHKIRFLGEYEEISIQHRVFSRTLFASGALSLLKWLHKQKPGVFTLRDISRHP